ncbi:hypothetical protein TSOC_006025 [Tetrabaena socialis]|uniref:Macro domain-containing protein n=1 Tax=Tetrabaena socialis TaxID=47790 RepID=A0A2J8A4T0_9CHLO|nr:hypothetical protein TSOC_006025 [Tetrabaena socialis]|eukprot:PNH07516.1 hypothetical protein TSOC_006025 [Tetrabaena socialis]
MAASGGPLLFKKEYQLLGNGPRLIICKGSIPDWPKLQNERPDPLTPLAVVNAVIHSRAGPELANELLERPLLRPGIRCPTGEAIETKGYNFNVDFIIHTCGPNYGSGERSRCKDDLTNAYRNSLTKAQQLGVKCVAFPAISTGLQAYPIEDATLVALSVLKDAKAPLEELWVVLFTQADFNTATGVAASLGLSEYVGPVQPPNTAQQPPLPPRQAPAAPISLAVHLQQQPEEPPHEAGNLNDKAELVRLKGSDGFRRQRAQDPCFRLLHFLAMLGHATLEEALEEARIHSVKLQHFARLARCHLQQPQQQAMDAVKAEDKVWANYGCTPLQLAAACGNLGMVEALLEPFRLHNREVATLINHTDLHIRFSALHGAVSQGQHEVALLLLQLGADPEAEDETRKTAFQVAPSHAVLRELLQLALQPVEGLQMRVTVHLMAEVLEGQRAEAEAATAREHTGEQLPGTPIRPNAEKSVEAMTSSFFRALCINVSRRVT